VWINGILFVINLILVGLFYKQFKICAFDPGMAAAVGINVSLMHYLLMGMVSVTTVGAFESVGAILVVAMFIVPAATAYLLTDRLSHMLVIAVGAGILSSVLGYQFARSLDCSIAGAMATVGGAFFLLAFLFSPSHGLLTRAVARWGMRRRLVEEDLLLWAWRRFESHAEPAFTVGELRSGQRWSVAKAETVVRRLARSKLLALKAHGYALTERGRRFTEDLIRRHRLYESYLHDLGYPSDHVHAPADRVEHHLSPETVEALVEATANPALDPQGKPIPRVPEDSRDEQEET
jgi:manganese/zinc/iron transport system permease protein